MHRTITHYVYAYVYSAPGVVEFRVNNLVATRATEVSWSPPLQPNGVVTTYQVIYSMYQSSAVVTSEMLSNTTNTYIIRNLGMEITTTAKYLRKYILLVFIYRARNTLSSNSGSVY